MTGLEIQEELARLIKGLKCSAVELYAPDSWSFDFGGELGFNIQCPWRIVNECGIAITGGDHGQKFGLPAPVDVAVEALKLLSGRRVVGLEVFGKTADFHLRFEGSLQLEVFNNSSGYEGWNCGTPSGLRMIALGGGGTVYTAAISASSQNGRRDGE